MLLANTCTYAAYLTADAQSLLQALLQKEAPQRLLSTCCSAFLQCHQPLLPESVLSADTCACTAYLSADAQSLLRALLQKEAPKRLGYGEQGSAQVQAHPFFRSISWHLLMQQRVRARLAHAR